MIKQFIFIPLDRPKYIYNCLDTIFYKMIFEKNKTLCFFLADWAFGGVQRIYIIFLEVRISDGPCLGKWGFLDYYTEGLVQPICQAQGHFQNPKINF